MKTHPNRAQSQLSWDPHLLFSSSSLSLSLSLSALYIVTPSLLQTSTFQQRHRFVLKMLTAPFPTPNATFFSVKSVSSFPRRVRFRPIASFATATSSSYLSPHSMASCTTLYEILGIRATASGDEIKAAYRRLARVCHPDVAPVDRKDSSAGEFMKIHAAYCTLSDPQKRASYDRSLFPRQRPHTTTSSRFSGYGGRKWETDQCW